MFFSGIKQGMMRTRVRLFSRALGLLSLALILSCSGQKSTLKEGPASGAETDEVGQQQSFQVAEMSQLPACTSSREGTIAYVKASKKLHACENGEWKELDLATTVRAASSETCSIRQDSGISSIICGSSSISIRDGIAQDGTACSVAKVGSVATLTCGQGSVTINDGAQGAEGSAGASCFVSKTGSVATVLCGQQSVQIFDGPAGQGCTVTKLGNVSTLVCGTQSVTISDGLVGAIGPQGIPGTPGTPGVNGFNSLVKLVDESPGVNCLGGGTKLLSGLDNGDGSGVANNGQLEAGEVDAFSFLCRSPSSFAIAGQKILSGETVIGTILKRFQTWKHDYNTYFLIPSDELFLVSNNAQTAKVLLRASRANNIACSGKVDGIYSIYETCADFDAPLTGHSDSSGLSVFYPNANCTGTPVVGRQGSFYVNSNPTNINATALLDFAASLGTDVHFKSGTQWMRLTNQTPSNFTVKSRGAPGSCVLVCYQSDYCSEGWNNNVTLSAYPFSVATPGEIGIPLDIGAGWKTY